MKKFNLLLVLSLLFASTSQAAIVNGSSSGTGADVGSTSKGLYAELIDSTGKLLGAARTRVTLYATNFTATTSEGMITLTPSRDNVDGSTGTSVAVTAAKRMALIALCVSTKNAGAAVQGLQVRVRVNPSGAATTSSPVVATAAAGTASATANVAGGMCTPISQGAPMIYEISGNNQVGISQIGTNTAGNDVSLIAVEY